MVAIFAIGINGEYGRLGTMPWGYEQKSDLMRFRDLTQGNIVIMGKNTFMSLPDSSGLSRRVNIVLSNTIEKFNSALTAKNEEELINIISKQESKKYLIGGKTTIMNLIHLVDTILLTRIEAEFSDCDNICADQLTQGFELINVEKHSSDENNKYNYRHETWRRI